MRRARSSAGAITSLAGAMAIERRRHRPCRATEFPARYIPNYALHNTQSAAVAEDRRLARAGQQRLRVRDSKLHRRAGARGGQGPGGVPPGVACRNSRCPLRHRPPGGGGFGGPPFNAERTSRRFAVGRREVGLGQEIARLPAARWASPSTSATWATSPRSPRSASAPTKR